MTTAAFAIWCRAFLPAKAIASRRPRAPRDARAKLSGLHFDLLILDVMMPGESGFDLARYIRKSSTVPIIMLTARNESREPHRGLQIGADDYVSKPFEPRELVLRIGNILKRAAPAAGRRPRPWRLGLTYFISSAASCAMARRSCT